MITVLLIFLILIFICCFFAPFVMSGRQSDYERRREWEYNKEDDHVD